jgi:hypothetical protein
MENKQRKTADKLAFQSELACKPLLGFSQFPWLYIISGHFGG